MIIDREACVGCEACQPYCPVSAISTIDWEGEQISEVNQDECVECGVCLRAEVCPTDAIRMPDLEWPRTIRSLFSNPLTRHPSTYLTKSSGQVLSSDIVVINPTFGVGLLQLMLMPHTFLEINHLIKFRIRQRAQPDGI